MALLFCAVHPLPVCYISVLLWLPEAVYSQRTCCSGVDTVVLYIVLNSNGIPMKVPSREQHVYRGEASSLILSLFLTCFAKSRVIVSGPNGGCTWNLVMVQQLLFIRHHLLEMIDWLLLTITSLIKLGNIMMMPLLLSTTGHLWLLCHVVVINNT